MAAQRRKTDAAGDVLKNPLRVRMLGWLAGQPQARTKREIGRALSLSNASVHYHVKQLEKAGLVKLEGTRPGPNSITEKLYSGKTLRIMDDEEKSEVYLSYTLDSISEMHREAEELIKSDWESNRFLVGCYLAHATDQETKKFKDRLTRILREFYQQHKQPRKDTRPRAVTFGIVPSSGLGWARSRKVFDMLT